MRCVNVTNVTKVPSYEYCQQHQAHLSLTGSACALVITVAVTNMMIRGMRTLSKCMLRMHTCHAASCRSRTTALLKLTLTAHPTATIASGDCSCCSSTEPRQPWRLRAELYHRKKYCMHWYCAAIPAARQATC
jgi:hypothetical protein